MPIRPPDWDWSFETEGALALAPALNSPEQSATVARMPPPGPHRRARATRRRPQQRERRLRRLAVLLAIALVALVTVLLSAFGGSGAPAAAPPPASASRLLPAGPPQPEIVARIGALHLQLPVSQSRVTAIGYQGGSAGSVAVDPLGTQANQGLLRRVVHSIFGGSSGGVRWFQLPGGQGPATSALQVGAAAGTDVYSPVDGTILSIGSIVLDGRTFGSRIEIQPTGVPSLVVVVSHVSLDPALVVGSPLTAGGSKLGSILDFSGAERQSLAHYTNDSGNHVVVEVHPAASLSLG